MRKVVNITILCSFCFGFFMLFPTSSNTKDFIKYSPLTFNAKSSEVFDDKDNKPKFSDESIAKNYASVQVADQISYTIENNSIMLKSSFIDQYAGLYIDENDELNVAGLFDTKYELISSNPKLIEFEFNYHVEEFSLEQLLSTKSNLEDMKSPLILGIDLVQRDNLLKIYISKGTMENVRKEISIRKIDISENMVDFVERETETEPLKSIKSGAKIANKTQFLWWWIENWYGTVGFSAIHNSTGKKGVVTNQHVAPLGTEMRATNNDLIGSSSVAILTNTVDASFIPYANQNDWTPTSYVLCGDPALYIGRVSTAYEGAKIWSQGASSGSTYGTVQSINASVTLEYESGIRTMTDLIKHNSGIIPGDSGGPLITWTDRRPEQGIYGLNFAGSSISDDSFSIKIANVLSALNVSVNFTK